MSAIFALRDAVVTADRYPLLAGVTAEFSGPNCLVVTGPNGAGKTSLLRLLAGLVPLTAGDARVLDFDLATVDRRVIRRHVGWLGHDGSFYDDLTVRENLRFAAKASGVTAACDDALERVGLASRGDLRARSLSAGQRRRMGLAWLILRRPALWLLDEPYASLDVNGRDLLDGLVADAVRDGASVVLTSHDDLRVAPADARALRLVGGRVVSCS